MVLNTRKRTHEAANSAQKQQQQKNKENEIDSKNAWCDEEPPKKKRNSLQFSQPRPDLNKPSHRRTTIGQSQPLKTMTNTEKLPTKTITTTQAAYAPQIALTNKRKVQTIQKAQSNPNFYFEPNVQPKSYDSPINKLIAKNKKGLKTMKSTDNIERNGPIEIKPTATINTIDTVLTTIAAHNQQQIQNQPLTNSKWTQKPEIIVHIDPTQSKFEIDQFNTVDYAVFRASVIIDRKSLSLNESKLKKINDGNIFWIIDWSEGDVVWAPKDANVFWPAIVQKQRKYVSAESRTFVKFLSDDGRTAWINSNSLVLFNGSSDEEKHCMTRPNTKDVSDETTVMEWKSATAEAELLLMIAKSDRMKFYDEVLMVALSSLDNELTKEIVFYGFHHSVFPSPLNPSVNIGNDQNSEKNHSNTIKRNVPASRTNVGNKAKESGEKFFKDFLENVKDIMTNRLAPSISVDGSEIDFKNTLHKLWSTRLSERNQSEETTQQSANCKRLATQTEQSLTFANTIQSGNFVERNSPAATATRYTQMPMDMFLEKSAKVSNKTKKGSSVKQETRKTIKRMMN